MLPWLSNQLTIIFTLWAPRRLLPQHGHKNMQWQKCVFIHRFEIWSEMRWLASNISKTLTRLQLFIIDITLCNLRDWVIQCTQLKQVSYPIWMEEGRMTMMMLQWQGHLACHWASHPTHGSNTWGTKPPCGMLRAWVHQRQAGQRCTWYPQK